MSGQKLKNYVASNTPSIPQKYLIYASLSMIPSQVSLGTPGDNALTNATSPGPQKCTLTCQSEVPSWSKQNQSVRNRPEPTIHPPTPEHHLS
ncbi:unnamed protein product [Linum trigynum]|uniref:Uncharacterized protein n=1 Tax=Linum trigynum TaxID=586398 RepID=A0AAV2F038_9ROSI